MKLTLDPANAYSSANKNRLVVATGCLSAMLQIAYEERKRYTGRGRPPPLEKFLAELYPFGIYKSGGGTVGENGAYYYPGDPTQYPLMKLESPLFEAYIYPNACVAWKQPDGEWFYTRMD